MSEQTKEARERSKYKVLNSNSLMIKVNVLCERSQIGIIIRGGRNQVSLTRGVS